MIKSFLRTFIVKPGAPPMRFIFVFTVLGFVAAAALLAQTPSPSLIPSPSPSPSRSPTPLRTPSPTPIPAAQNFHQWGSISVFNGLPSDSVLAITQTADGIMWFGTDNGIARFDGRRIQNFSPGGPESNRILALKTASTGELWIGTASGAFVYASNRFVQVEGTDGIGITSIYVGSGIYLGADTGIVLETVRGEDGSFAARPVGDGAVSLIDGTALGISSLAGLRGAIAAGTHGNGAYILRGTTAERLESSPRPLFVNSIAITESDVWLGTDAAKGLSGIYRVAGGKAIRITAPTSDVLSLESNTKGIWAGTERYGLFHIEDGKLKKNYTFENTSGGLRSDNIFSLFTDREGVLWVGTNRGVSRFDSEGPFQENVSDTANGNFIRVLFRSSGGRIYAGSNRGLFVRNGDRWTPLPEHGSGPVFSLSESAGGRLIVGSGGPGSDIGENGVYVTRNGQREKIADAQDVRHVYDEGESVWAATTTRGLLHARRDEQLGWLVSAVGFEEGLPSDKAFWILPTDKGLLVATNRGVVTYRPGKVPPKLVPVRILSQKLHAPEEFGSTIDLAFPQNSILVEVAGQSSRTFPEEFQYAFRLANGSNETLHKRLSNDPQYAPAGLRPGEYTIEVTAFDRDLNASEPLTFRFTVAKAPFPWTATTLAALLLLALGGLIWAIIEHRRIRERSRELAAARFDLANEAERERSRIARDLHDQTLADLRSLIMMSDRIVPDKPEFRREIEAISSEIRRICEDLSPSVLENVGLIPALEFLLRQTFELGAFAAGEGVDERLNLPVNTQLQIYRIAQEVLTNIRSHSTADSVQMSIAVEPDGMFELVVLDNGEPFSPDYRQKGRGIGNIRSRADLIKGNVEWKTRRTGGNKFRLTVSG
jgi:signal transduction histidine kinase/ligand-binding sensor domain-containing protein